MARVRERDEVSREKGGSLRWQSLPGIHTKNELECVKGAGRGDRRSLDGGRGVQMKNMLAFSKAQGKQAYESQRSTYGREGRVSRRLRSYWRTGIPGGQNLKLGVEGRRHCFLGLKRGGLRGLGLRHGVFLDRRRRGLYVGWSLSSR